MSRWANFARFGVPKASTDLSVDAEEWIAVSTDDNNNNPNKKVAADPNYVLYG